MLRAPWVGPGGGRYHCSAPGCYQSVMLFYHCSSMLLLFLYMFLSREKRVFSINLFWSVLFFNHFFVALFSISSFFPVLPLTEGLDGPNQCHLETVTLHQMKEHPTGSPSFDINKNCDLRKSLLP